MKQWNTKVHLNARKKIIGFNTQTESFMFASVVSILQKYNIANLRSAEQIFNFV